MSTLAFNTPTVLFAHRTRMPAVTPRPAQRIVTTPKRVCKMVLSEERGTESITPIRITGNNITLTDSLRAYINDKLSKVTRRFGNMLSKVDVHLTVEHNPSIHNNNKTEVVVFAGKTILRTEVRSDDMYAAIDAVEDRIGRTIRKFKERKEAKVSKGPALEDAPIDDDDGDASDEMYQDEYEPEVLPGVPAVNAVVRKKVFPMPLQTVEEAVLCCEYVDHPWYLFRNAATKEISLVYKRNHGGFGLIEPSNPDSIDEQVV